MSRPALHEVRQWLQELGRAEREAIEVGRSLEGARDDWDRGNVVARVRGFLRLVVRLIRRGEREEKTLEGTPEGSEVQADHQRIGSLVEEASRSLPMADSPLGFEVLKGQTKRLVEALRAHIAREERYLFGRALSPGGPETHPPRSPRRAGAGSR